MANFTPEQLKAAYDQLVKEYGVDEAEKVVGPLIDDLEAEMSGAIDDPAAMSTAPIQDVGLKETGRAARFIGPFAGGVIGSGAGARLATAPAVARGIEAIKSRALRGLARGGIRAAQPAGDFAGQVVGDIAGRRAAGDPQNIIESLATAGIGTGAGVAYRAGTRGAAGFLGDVPRFAIEEAGVPTAGVLPSIQRVMRPKPTGAGQVFAGVSDEARLADKVRAATKRLTQKVTPQRAEKVRILRQADAAGVRIDIEPILQKIIDETPTMRAEPSTAAFARHLDRFANGLVDETAKRGGMLTPSQLDEFIRTNLAPKSFTAAGAPAQTRVGPVIREIKKLSTDLLNKHLPPEVRQLNKQISEFLDQADDAASLFGEQKSGVIGRLRDLFKPGNEENTQAFEFLARQADKSISRQARTLATQRAFTVDPRETTGAAGRFGALVRSPFEAVGQAMAPFQAFAGPATGGAVAREPFQTPVIGDILRSIQDLLAPRERNP